MAAAKSTTLTFRIEPALKEALRSAAEHEHRSIANMVEVLIRDYCRSHGIPIPEKEGPSHLQTASARKAKGRRGTRK